MKVRASVNGITVSSLKEFKGHEGEPLFQGNVYYRGKKQGFWSQDGHGGIYDHFNFDETPIEAEAERYKNSGAAGEDAEYFDASLLMAVIADLIMTEKEYRKAVKRGMNSLVKISASGFEFTVGMRAKAETDEEKEAVLEKYGEQIRNDAKKHLPKWAQDDIRLRVFGKPEDFIIDEGEPAEAV